MVMRKTSLLLEEKGDHAVVDEVARAMLSGVKLLASLEAARPLSRATPHQSLTRQLLLEEKPTERGAKD